MNEAVPDGLDKRLVAPCRGDGIEQDLRLALQAEREARLRAERLLAEKEELLARNDVLMREVDHRVKNSFQIVASVLHIQARQLPNGAAAQALEDARQRVAGIAAVHELLYRASDAELVDMAVFLQGLCTALAMNKPGRVGVVEVTADPITFTSKRAMKVGMLVSELIGNAFKHAYPDGRRGDVHVALVANGEMARLIVSDEGIGLPADFPADGGRGLGMRLIRSVLSQFDGRMATETGSGARFMIDIPWPQSPPPSWPAG
jgi:two-component sensor histidine kinase